MNIIDILLSIFGTFICQYTIPLWNWTGYMVILRFSEGGKKEESLRYNFGQQRGKQQGETT